MSLTRHVAEWIATLRPEDVPETARREAIVHVLDTVGVALAGSQAPLSAILREQIGGAGGAAQATVIGSALRVSAQQAALANGAAAHALDYDDTQLAERPDRVYGLLTHPSAPVLPAVLALAEVTEASGREALAAYIIGVEVACKLAEAANPRLYEAGFHTTGVVGALGASAGAAWLLTRDAEVIARAISVAASMAGGLREQFGTMTKPLHAGRAAENGVVAAQLAAAGFTAAENVLEASRGFFSAYAGGFDEQVVRDRLGNPWSLLEPGVSLKPAPSGSLTHPAIDATLDLLRKHDVHPEQVESIQVGVNRHMPNALLHTIPTDELQAKFSLPYAVAVTLLDRAAGLAQFTDERVRRPDVSELVRRVQVAIDPEAEAAGYHQMFTRVTLRLRDGRTLSAQASFARGSPQRPFTQDELLAKFRECAALALPPTRVEELIAAIERIEEAPDVRGVLALTRPER